MGIRVLHRPGRARRRRGHAQGAGRARCTCGGDQGARFVPGRGAVSFDATKLANPATAALRAYDPGHDLPLLRRRFGAAIAELGSNENPLGPSPLALAAMREALASAWRYPDPRGAALKAALSRSLRVEAERVVLGNGSHELLMLLA